MYSKLPSLLTRSADSLQTPTHPNYLPHLDGLRAIALIGVLLFHFQVPHFQGGFAGVDVFLSLSGFLITRNILRQLSENKFTLGSFYKRRFFRLYPASIATVLLTLCFGFLTFPPDIFKTFGNSAIAALLFYANIFFNIQSGYFDSSADTKPFLHFWSLSLEEQYYLIWAPLIVFIYRRTKRSNIIATVLMLMLFISLIFSVLLNDRYPSFVFFQLPSRIWQFAAGALTAVLTKRSSPSIFANRNETNSKPIKSHKHCDPIQNQDPNCSGVGVDTTVIDAHNRSNPQSTTIVASNWSQIIKELLCFSAFITLFSSYFLLPPSAAMYMMIPTTLSTCVILSLGDTFFATHVLSFPLLRTLGHMSYSAYLVHWPLFVFLSHWSNSYNFDKPNAVIMTIVTLGMSVVLRQQIEDPMRHGHRRKLLILITIVAFLFAITIVQSDGFPARVGNVDTDVSQRTHGAISQSACEKYSPDDPRFSGLPKNACIIGNLNGTQGQYAFLGDSFTKHLTSAIKDIAFRRGEWYVAHFQGGCKFLSMRVKKDFRTACKPFLDGHWTTLRLLSANSTIVVGNHWRFANTDKLKKRSKMTYVRMLNQDILKSGHKMILIGEPPGVLHVVNNKYFACADRSLLLLSRLWLKLQGKEFKGAASCIDVNNGLAPRTGRMREQKEYTSVLPKIVPDVKYVDVMTHLCHEDKDARDNSSCLLPIDTSGIMYDNGYTREGSHLSTNGSLYLSRFYEREIFETSSSRYGDKVSP